MRQLMRNRADICSSIGSVMMPGFDDIVCWGRQTSRRVSSYRAYRPANDAGD
jgi:hypothetical protein